MTIHRWKVFMVRLRQNLYTNTDSLQMNNLIRQRKNMYMDIITIYVHIPQMVT